MTLVLLLCLAVAAVSGIWSTHRHRQLVAWDRELAAARGERPDIPRHRAL
jgi:cell division protein FtsL